MVVGQQSRYRQAQRPFDLCPLMVMVRVMAIDDETYPFLLDLQVRSKQVQRRPRSPQTDKIGGCNQEDLLCQG